jgi:CheY-like chemotaxis protein
MMDWPSKPNAALRALVVDDSTDTAQSTGELLTVHGFCVHVATTGREAIRIALTEKPDVVLLDLSMPMMDGFEIARQIREGLPQDAKHPIFIAMTGYGSEEDRARTAAAGFQLHLTKPVEPDHLIRALRQSASASRQPDDSHTSANSFHSMHEAI